MKNPFGNLRRSCSLPHVVGENSQSGPDRCACRPSCQHSTQTKLAFQHADGGLNSAAKPLQLPKPRFSLMGPFRFAQAAHLRDPNPLNPGFSQLQYVFGTIIAAVRRQLGRLYPQSALCLTQHRKQFGTIAWISFSNFIVNDHTGTILDELQRAPKLHGLDKFPLADGSRFRIVKRNYPLRDRLLSLKFLLGLTHNGLGQFDLLRKPLLKLVEFAPIPNLAKSAKLCGSAPRFGRQGWRRA